MLLELSERAGGIPWSLVPLLRPLTGGVADGSGLSRGALRGSLTGSRQPPAAVGAPLQAPLSLEVPTPPRSWSALCRPHQIPSRTPRHECQLGAGGAKGSPRKRCRATCPSPQPSRLCWTGCRLPVPSWERRPGHRASPTLWLSWAFPGAGGGDSSRARSPFPPLVVGVALTCPPYLHLPGAAPRPPGLRQQ